MLDLFPSYIAYLWLMLTFKGIQFWCALLSLLSVFLFSSQHIRYICFCWNLKSNIFSGLHEDEAEVTLNVCLGKEFSGGDLFFQGVRCDAHVTTNTQPEVWLLPYYYGKIIFMLNNLSNYIGLQHTSEFCFKLQRENNNACQLMIHTHSVIWMVLPSVSLVSKSWKSYTRTTSQKLPIIVGEPNKSHTKISCF